MKPTESVADKFQRTLIAKQSTGSMFNENELKEVGSYMAKVTDDRRTYNALASIVSQMYDHNKNIQKKKQKPMLANPREVDPLELELQRLDNERPMPLD